MPAFFAFIFLTLPWLNPFSPGPLAQELPLLFAWTCAAGVLLTFAVDRQRGQHATMVRALALGWATAAGLNALIGLLQYVGATAALGVWVNHTEVGAAFGNLRQRNQFATLLGIGLAVALWWSAVRNAGQTEDLSANACWQDRFFRWPDYLRRHAALVAPLLAAWVGVANAASGSRTGLMQLLLLLGLTLWWWRSRDALSTDQKKRVRLTLLAALAGYAMAQVLLPLLVGLDPLEHGALVRLREGDRACAGRLTLWGNVLHLVAQKPWLGWGWGELDYAHFITLYPGTRFCDILDNAHNLPLHLAVEWGVPAALLICGTALWLIWRGRPWAERDPTRQMAWSMLAVIGLHSLLEYPLWYGPFQTAALLAIWLLCWHPAQVDQPLVPAPARRALSAVYVLAALALLGYCAFAAWQYHVVSQIYLDPAQRAPAYRDRTLDKMEQAWLYQDVAHFAWLTLTELRPDNATAVNVQAKEMLHFSPEAQVVERVLDSARLLGRKDEVAFYAARYQAAFPTAYARWAAQQAQPAR